MPICKGDIIAFVDFLGYEPNRDLRIIWIAFIG